MSGGVDQSDDLRRTARLLRETFDVPRFADARYLEWFYRENPNGAALEENVDEGDRRIGHLAGIPQVYHRRGAELRIVFPLNIAVAPAARGRGLMTTLSQRCFEAARQRLGVVAFVGMPNASSTPGYTGRLGFRLVRPLPVVICLPWSPAGWKMRSKVRSIEVTRAYLESEAFRTLTGSIDFTPGPAWSQQWSARLLRWRLAAPDARYWLHVGEGLVGVSCRTHMFGVPFAVILKLLPRIGARAPNIGASPADTAAEAADTAAGAADTAAGAADAAAVVTAACLSHRAPAAAYAGFNARARVSGVPVPDRLKPAPLNLIFRSMDETVIGQEDFAFDTFEFLDFDAY